ncbi:AfsR/SARP family transcriptional regulator [Nocardia crassostreae]|uniref:AfsR/SARP family transcriptional regulator n=1 Tax=Nocardia crassostreae TaxID=53428 RepID=UPI000A3FA292|nr:BTAD domain-containing putative transcriptional regulator [Nocardia crassostreae]
MRFKVLGPVEIEADGRPLPGTAPRHRAVLAYLLLNAGQVLSADRIIDAIWGLDAPGTARSQIHAAITAIRRALRRAEADDVLETRGAAGYVLRIQPDRLDLAEFGDLVARAQATAAHDPAVAVETLRAASALWHGEPLADVSADYVPGARIRLTEKRLTALERLLELELALGRNDLVLDELTAHATEHPLRERLHAHLVLALHRAGRQADALAAARRFRTTLAESQGLDPSRAFLTLEQAVLRDDPVLAAPIPAPHRSTAPPNTSAVPQRSAASRSGAAGPTAAMAREAAVPRLAAESRGVAAESVGEHGAGPKAIAGVEREGGAPPEEASAVVLAGVESRDVAPAAGGGVGPRAVAAESIDAAPRSVDPRGAGAPLPRTNAVRSARATSAGGVFARESRESDPEFGVGAPPRPDFLPYDVPDFAGRGAELDQLLGDAGAATVVVIDGMAGIGKTSLAIHTAHRVAERFPDGRLFVDLQGHTPGSSPVSAAAVLEILLRQLGIAADRIPQDAVERAALWRAELASRAVVAVLDNAADAEQVRPLLPGASRSLLLVTSRRRLIDLDGARAVSVELLPAEDAVELFGRIVGARARAEPVAVLDVLQLCGFLPLAVRIAAARLQHRPRWSVEYLAGRLRDERRKLAELATADRGVAAAFTVSYEQLTPEQQRMFRLFGLHPGRDVDPHAAAALAGVSYYEAEDLLEDLLDAHMLIQHEPGRYTCHDLLREYARGTVGEVEPAADRQAATTRLFEHYLHHARAAVDRLFPYGAAQRPLLPAPVVPVRPFPDDESAAAWLDAERENLITAAAAAERCEWPFRVGELAATLRPYLDGNSRHADALTPHNAALRVARTLADPAAEARALTDLGWTAWRSGDYAGAERWSAAAVTLCREIGDGYEEARALNTLGNVALRRRDHDSAATYFAVALTLAQTVGNRVGEAHVLGNLGKVFDQSGRFADAEDHLTRALSLHRELGNRRGEALVFNYLGSAYRRAGDHRRARDHHHRAAQLYTELGNPSDRAASLNGLGETARAAGDPARALTEHGEALRLAEETANHPELARAHDGMARAEFDRGNLPAARTHAEAALTRYQHLEVPDADDIRAFLDPLTAGLRTPKESSPDHH